MSNKKGIIFVILMTIFAFLGFIFVYNNPNIIGLSAAASKNEELRSKYQKAVVETAYQYYYRNSALQYDAITMNYEKGNNTKYTSHPLVSAQYKNSTFTKNGMEPQGMYPPEEATTQDYHFFVCSHFPFAVYADAFQSLKGDKYQITNKSGEVTHTTAGYNRIANKDNDESYRKDLAILSLRETKTYKFKDNADSIIKKFKDKLKPGDIIIYGSETGGHAMLYVGDDIILDSGGNAPKGYSSISAALNDFGVQQSKYHLESKSDMIDTDSGTYEVSSDKLGTIHKGSWSKKLNAYINASAKDKILSIIRPINELIDTSKWDLSTNAQQRLKKPGLVLTKKASVEKYESVNLGDNIKYTITLTNKSKKNYDVTVKEQVPAYTTLVDLSDTCKNENGKITCDVTVKAGGKTSVFFKVKVNKDLNNLGKTVVSDKGKANGIPLKKISTKINKTLTKTERETLSSYAKSLSGKSYESSEKLVNDVYKKLNYDLNMLSAKKLFDNFYINGKYKIVSGEYAKRTLFKVGTTINTYNLKEEKNISSKYKKYYNMFVDGLYGGVSTSAQFEEGNTHYRNVAFKTTTLMAGDVLYVLDENYKNDAISKKGGYIVGEKNLYLYLGNGEFATVKDNKVYIYSNKTKYDYYMYRYDRSVIKQVDYNNSTDKNNGRTLKKVTIGERLLTSLIGQNSFIVLRPSYSIEELPTKIEVTKMPNKIDYIQNLESVSLAGGELKITYGSAGTKTINLDNKDVTVTDFNNTKIGPTTATINYKGLKTTINLNIVAKSVTGISVNKNPTKLNYVQSSEKLDLTGGSLLVKYNDGSSSTIEMTTSGVTASGFNNTKLGKNTITIKYLNKTTSFQVNIISPSITELTILNNPNKTNYIEGENIDLIGGILGVTYNNNKTEQINLPDKNVKVSGYNKNVLGYQTVTLEYKGAKTSFEVTVFEKQIVKIEMENKPKKTTYISNKEDLDLTGGTIKVTYDNKKQESIKLTSPNVEVIGFNKEKIGKQKLTVKYKEYETSFQIEVIEKPRKTVEAIRIKQLPNKKVYTKDVENLDLTGGSIEVTYTDGSSEIVNLTSSSIKVSGFSNKNSGKTTLTINYFDKTTSFEVEIKERQIESVEVINPPEKVEYSVGEKIDVSGGKIQVKYSDNTSEEIELTSPNVELTDKIADSGEKEVKANYANKVFSFAVDVKNKFVDMFIEDDDADEEVDYSEYGYFFDAIKMTPVELVLMMVGITVFAIVFYIVMRKFKLL